LLSRSRKQPPHFGGRLAETHYGSGSDGSGHDLMRNIKIFNSLRNKWRPLGPTADGHKFGKDHTFCGTAPLSEEHLKAHFARAKKIKKTVECCQKISRRVEVMQKLFVNDFAKTKGI
jgi:hypothetical protein